MIFMLFQRLIYANFRLIRFSYILLISGLIFAFFFDDWFVLLALKGFEKTPSTWPNLI